MASSSPSIHVPALLVLSRVLIPSGAGRPDHAQNVPVDFQIAHEYHKRSKVVLRMGGKSWPVTVKRTGRPATAIAARRSGTDGTSSASTTASALQLPDRKPPSFAFVKLALQLRRLNFTTIATAPARKIWAIAFVNRRTQPSLNLSQD